MPSTLKPWERWNAEERSLLKRLDRPARIQEWLDGLVYRAEDRAACPRRVIAERKAHCFDGAVFAALALRRLGHAPMLVDLRAVRDDDHVLAVFRRGALFGAVAKSNFVGLRFREPIHRSVRELALSYFEDYFNSEGEKTLRSASLLVDLRRFDRLDWANSDDALETISDALDDARHHALLSAPAVKLLEPVDPRSLKAGMVGTRKAGLYRP